MENKYTQVRNYVLGLLERGKLTGEGKLPGARELASQLGISLLTVQNALETLVNEGVLRVIPRQGTFADPAWESRILQSNVSFYMPEKHLPWSFLFREIVAERLPQLHLTHRMRNGIFEIRPTLDVQIRHKAYLDAEPFFRKCCSQCPGSLTVKSPSNSFNEEACNIRGNNVPNPCKKVASNTMRSGGKAWGRTRMNFHCSAAMTGNRCLFFRYWNSCFKRQTYSSSSSMSNKPEQPNNRASSARGRSA